MDEVFPVLAGIVLGLGTYAVRTSLRAVLIAVLGVAFGVVAAWISRELVSAWVYALIDTAQVIGAALGTGLLVTLWARRRARSAAR